MDFRDKNISKAARPRYHAAGWLAPKLGITLKVDLAHHGNPPPVGSPTACRGGRLCHCSDCCCTQSLSTQLLGCSGGYVASSPTHLIGWELLLQVLFEICPKLVQDLVNLILNRAHRSRFAAAAAGAGGACIS